MPQPSPYTRTVIHQFWTAVQAGQPIRQLFIDARLLVLSEHLTDDYEFWSLKGTNSDDKPNRRNRTDTPDQQRQRQIG